MSISYENSKTILLSYPLNQYTPHYGSIDRGVEIVQNKSIAMGDSCNTFEITINNHLGTHIDCPHHFYKNGKKILDYNVEDFVFFNPQILKIELQEGELLSVEKIDGKVKSSTDFLIFYTGWGMFRKEYKYSLKNPGVHAEVAEYLREKYSNIRAVGMDFISISSYLHRDEGKIAHKAFLNPEKKEILIVEDMRINETTYKYVEKGCTTIVSPIWIDGIDSAPCSVFML